MGAIVASEVAAPRLGELRSSDLVAAYGRALIEMGHVDVLVLSTDGAVAARVELGPLRSGVRFHTALVCDGCGRVVRHLMVHDRELRCRGCAKVITDHQRGRTTADWCRRGAREADRLLRLVANPARRLTPRKLGEARRLAQQILDTDRARVAVIQEGLALLCVEAEQ